MPEDKTTRRDVRADIVLAKSAMTIINDATDGRFRDRLPELTSILHALEGASRRDPETLNRLLPDFMHANPEILLRLYAVQADETLEFARNVCAHYQDVKRRRPLTDDEKLVGHAMLQLFHELLAGLGELKGRQ